MNSDILQVKSPIVHEDHIQSQQYHTYAPYSTTFDNNDEIRITIQSQDLYVLPSDSYLHIEFTVNRPNAAPIAENAAIFSHFFLSHMFSEMRYELNGFEIDRCKTPGITSLLKNLVACKEENRNAMSLYNLNGGGAVTAGAYRMILPLCFLFGFCDDFNKIILNSKHELILVRHRSDLNIYVGNADLNLHFTVNKIVWKIPHVGLSDAAKLSMLRTISQNNELSIPFRSWDLYELPVVPQTQSHTWCVKTTNKVNKPRYVIVAFQENRNNVATSNPSEFDHCNVSNMKLYLNNERFPYDDYNLQFTDGFYHELFLTISKIQQSYYNGTAGTNPLAEWTTYASMLQRPIFAFDCTRSDESIKPGMVDVRLEIQTRANIRGNTSAYCLIIHDNLVRYSPFTSMVHRDI